MSKNLINTELIKLQHAIEKLAGMSLSPEGDQVVSIAQLAVKNLEIELKQNAEATQLQALYQVSRMLGTSLNLDDVLNQVIDAVIELTGAERGYLLLIDQDTQQLSVKAARGLDKAELEETDKGFSRSVVRSVLEQGRGVITTDAKIDPRFADQQSVIMHDLRSILCVPLRWRTHIIGVIHVDNRVQAGTFSEEVLELTETFATQAAAAIENARLYTRTDRDLFNRVTELEMMTEIDRQLNATLDISQVAAITLDWALRGTGGESGLIALENPDTDMLDIVAGDGKDSSIPKNDSIIIEIWQLEETTVLSRPAGSQLLGTPIFRAGKPVGIIVVKNQEEFSDSEAHFLTRLAGHASIALDNARLHREVQRANASKSKFISVVVHELRIPMTAIKGYADLLRQGAVGPVTETQKGFLDVIRNNVNRMAALTSDLSDLNRVESGRMKLELIPMAIGDTVSEVVQSLKPEFAAKNQSLQVNVPSELPKVYADPQRVSQVIANLLSNATKYSSEGSTVQIYAALLESSEDHAAMIKLDVVDHGGGISNEEQSKLFTPFFRSDANSVREQQGWGLGLSVARSLVELMGGEIGVKSEFGSGSTFWFTLPCKEDY